jgi:hypothetical protein
MEFKPSPAQVTEYLESIRSGAVYENPSHVYISEGDNTSTAQIIDRSTPKSLTDTFGSTLEFLPLIVQGKELLDAQKISIDSYSRAMSRLRQQRIKESQDKANLY